MTRPETRERPGAGAGPNQNTAKIRGTDSTGAVTSSSLSSAACTCRDNRPVLVDWVVTSVEELGLTPHAREGCPYCAEVGNG